MKMHRVVGEGDIRPAWHGLGYYDCVRGEYHCYLVPFHLFVRAGRFLWYRFLMLNMDNKACLEQSAYSRGYKDGEKNTQCHLENAAYKRGWKDAMAGWRCQN